MDSNLVGMIIYCVTNKINGKQYVGLTTRSIEERMLEHFKYHVNDVSALHRAIKKYGHPSFTYEVVQHCTNIDELLQAEADWILKLGSLSPNGYNLTAGGENPVPSEETRRKLSAAGMGRKQTAEAIAKMRAARSVPVWQHSIDGTPIKLWPSAVDAGEALGIDNSTISACVSGRRNRHTCGSFRWSLTGGQLPPILRKKAVRGANTYTEAYKPIVLVDGGGVVLEHFDSQKQACERFSIDPSSMAKHLRGKLKTVGGRRFRRV